MHEMPWSSVCSSGIFLCLHPCDHLLGQGVAAFSRRHLGPFPARPPPYQASSASPVPLLPVRGHAAGVRNAFSVRLANPQVPTWLPSPLTPAVSSRLPDTLSLENSQEELAGRAESCHTHVTVFYREQIPTDPSMEVTLRAEAGPLLASRMESPSWCLWVTLGTRELPKPGCPELSLGSVFLCS